MTSTRAEEWLNPCHSTVDVFTQKSYFVGGLSQGGIEQPHAQLMKICCGGLLGMQRVLDLN
jgi:hypothetical protein